MMIKMMMMMMIIKRHVIKVEASNQLTSTQISPLLRISNTKTSHGNQTSLCIMGAFCFVTIITFYNWLIIRKKRTQYPQYPLPPGPKGWPIIGCIPEMIKNKPSISRWIHKLMQEFNTEIACIPLGNTNVIPLTSPELAREFLKKQDVIFASRPDCMSARRVSDGYLITILSPVGDQWKKMRRIITSERCHEEADLLVNYVYNQCQNLVITNGLVNVRVAARHYYGSVVRRIVFGKRFFGIGMEDGGPGREEEEHMDGLFTTIFHLYAFAIADFVPWLEVFDLDGYKKIIKNAIKSMRKCQDPEIDNRVEMWKQGIRKTEEDILDVVINIKESKNNPLLSIQELNAQITWALAEMINQPHILDKAYKELDKVVCRDRVVDESDLSKLNYLKAFRMHPINPFNASHVSVKDTVVGGYFIPKGSHVLPSRIGLGQKPRTWEDPLKYKPERHIINESTKVMLVVHELNMFSFSTGRRGCPAIMLGSTIVTMLFARLIQGFNWTAPPNGWSIDLNQSEGDAPLAKPLIAHASPRLETHVYANLL
ncbi:Cytochrome P450 CYP2 subfamily [Handroanthus impetiginosus]|uniref:Cytochrome P450 CYP2 subfamily n=1 Tax=Handroanthus impetiginosus TaxID=429701 RepID=A0A2G9GF07_9LAMI|nr:Cytochrome P450 CYP2 subfamily [Handroanthus impetiginosus]